MADKSVVVTGGASGIGAAACTLLQAEGWSVICLDLIVPLATENMVVYVKGDASSRRDLVAAAEIAAARAPLRGWVNNAAVPHQEQFLSLDDETIDRIIEVDLLSVVRGSQEAISAFGGKGGAIVNVSSIHAVRGFARWSLYDMCKGGVEALTRSLAAEFAADQVRVNAVSPGSIRSLISDQMLENASDQAAELKRLGSIAPAQRLGDPAEVAHAIVWLLGEQASFVTGHVLAVDGGAAAWMPDGAER